MTLRQYWYAASLRPCLDLPPGPRETREAVRELVPPAGEGLGAARLGGRELEGVVDLSSALLASYKRNGK
jgi:hypothetical protein